MNVPKIKAQGKVVDLNQNHYKAAGGEGTVFVKSGTAYKIYHDPAKMIPVGKIKELASINLPHVLGPQYPITDLNDKPIGFAMRYVDKTEYLCKLFTRGFRDTNGVDPAMINALVKRMQDTLKVIHSKQILVVDYNELNFLTDKDFKEAYHIDVDCYKTPTYPATAIMESIRDPKVQGNKFTELSDWYSAAIIFFQLYMGTHPYKGRHPDYGKDWQAMMKAGVSVFNKATRLPPNVQDWSVVPKGHLKWFEKVFEHGERCAPPEPDQVLATAGQVVPQIVASTDKFVLSLLRTYDSAVQAIRWINGICYARTEKSIYADSRAIASHSPVSGFTAKRIVHDFVYVQNDQPVKIEFNSITETLSWTSFDGKVSGQFDATGYFVANNRLYVVNNGNLIEYSFMNLGAKVIASQQIVNNVFMPSYKVFDGVVLQDVLGVTHASLPVIAGHVNFVKLDFLNRVRVIDAQYRHGTLVVIGEMEGKFSRWTASFDKAIRTCTVRKEENVVPHDIQLAVLDKGVSVATNDDKVELFLDSTKVKQIDDSPFTGNQKLLSFGNDIYMLNRNELHKVSTK